MYQQYVASLNNKNTERAENILQIEQKVNLCWDIIDAQCFHQSSKEASAKQVKSIKPDWKTVRIFVSSTFTDFHNEREILVKKVFPALHEWCESRKLHIVECDLRWGVPKDSTTRTTIITCLEEIERCHKENNGEPFFINLLGERYGWVPEESEVPEDIKSQYEWVPGTSITHMEIQYGAYRCRNPNAVFFLRKPDFLDDLESTDLVKFKDGSSFSNRHLKILKEKLKTRFDKQVFEYSCRYAGMDCSTGRQLVKLEGLDEFADQVLLFFKTAICKKYPEVTDKDHDRDDVFDEVSHEMIMEAKSSNVYGRDREIEIVKKFSTGIADSSLNKFTHEDLQEDADTFNSRLNSELLKLKIHDDDDSFLAVIGESGMGKSALLARVAKDLIQDGYTVVYHCVGVTSSSFQDHTFLLRILAAISPLNAGEMENFKFKSAEELLPLVVESFSKFRNSDKRIILVIDGVNELSNSEGPNRLMWLLPKTPKNVRWIISCNSQHRFSMNSIKEKNPYYLELSEFSQRARQYLVEQYFSVYNKKLADEDVKGFISHSGASIPLWLSMACEELRVFGDFRMLSKKIEALPANLDGLFQSILQRLLSEDETGKMKRTLRVIRCSQGGLPESQILGLLADASAGESQVPLLTWATIRRSIKALLRTVRVWYSGEAKIQYCHNAVVQFQEFYHENWDCNWISRFGRFPLPINGKIHGKYQRKAHNIVAQWHMY